MLAGTWIVPTRRCLTIVTVLTIATAPVPAQSGGGTPASQTVQSPSPTGESIQDLYVNFIHYAKLGRFRLSDAYAQKLLNHPELDPSKVLSASDIDPEGIKTLITLIRRSQNASFRENAAKILQLITEGEHVQAQSRARILANIKLLGGTPQQESFAIRYLADSGEYAVPHMLAALLDPNQRDLWPRIVNALPKLGKAAVNPLVIALRMKNNGVRLFVLEALGEIGYAQAMPYLRALATNDQMPEGSRLAANRAINRIDERTGRSFPGSATELYYGLAQLYFDENQAVRADPRLELANIWYWSDNTQQLKRVEVPQRIFGQVMAMRCSQEAMALQNNSPDALALWLAANFRRESRLGMDVESGNPDATGEPDATRPDIFPRAQTFSKNAGPLYAHLVLDRAMRTRDSSVALAAIETLRMTAGESSLIGTEDYKQPLVQALQFPDLLVRLRAALALGSALPKSQFTGAELVVPLLGMALAQSGREQVLVVETDQTNLNRIVSSLRDGNRDTIGHASFFSGLERAFSEFSTLSAVMISTDIADPTVEDALGRLRRQQIYAKTPVVVLAKPGQGGVADAIAEGDPYVEVVVAGARDEDILAALERVRARTGQSTIRPDLAQSIALQAAETLRNIAVDGRTVFNVLHAEPALIAAMGSPQPRLQVAAASVLALLPTQTAQRAIAHMALDASNSKALRIDMFQALADSARKFGNWVEKQQIDRLIQMARDDTDLTIRDAASGSLGALNLASNKAGEIVRSYYGG